MTSDFFTPACAPARALRPARAALTAIACAGLLALSACSHAPDASQTSTAIAPSNVRLTADQQAHVSIRTVAATAVGGTIAAVGAVDFDNDRATSVVAPFSGPVARVLVQPGQQVHKGEALATVDSADFSAAIDAYAKALVAAKNLRKIAVTDLDLLKHQGVSQRESDQAQADAASADADRDAALQALTALGVDPTTIAQAQAGKVNAGAQGTIRAPFAGTIAEKLIAPGTLLQAGSTACFTLADLSRVWVMAQVSTSDLPAVAVGDPVEVLATAGGKPQQGTVDNIAAVVDPDTRAVLVRVRVDNPGDSLKKGMYVRVRIRARNTQQGVVAPTSAILRDDENLPFVYVMASDGSFARRHVTLGARDGDNYAIAQGLNPGDRYVADGGLFMQFMQAQ